MTPLWQQRDRLDWLETRVQHTMRFEWIVYLVCLAGMALTTVVAAWLW